MGWIDIPAHRILIIDWTTLMEEFDCLSQNGTSVKSGERPYIVIRRNDQKQFKPARFWPTDSIAKKQYCLEEW